MRRPARPGGRLLARAALSAGLLATVALIVPARWDRARGLLARDPALGAAIALWGDSQSTDGSGYADELAGLFPARTIYREGIGGQKTAMIAARMDAIPVQIKREVVLPPSGSATLAADMLSIDLFRTLSARIAARVTLGSVPCALVFDPAGGGGHGAYTLTPLRPLAAALKVPAGTRLEPISGFVPGTDAASAPELSTLLEGVVVIRAGRNDLNAPYPLATGLDLLAAMVRQARRHTSRIVVVGQMLGYADLPRARDGAAPDDARGAMLLGQQSRWNAALAQRWPDYWADVQAYHVAHGGGQHVKLASPAGTAGDFVVLTPTAQTPALVDGIHENAAGQLQAAEMLRAIIAARKL